MKANHTHTTQLYAHNYERKWMRVVHRMTSGQTLQYVNNTKKKWQATYENGRKYTRTQNLRHEEIPTTLCNANSATCRGVEFKPTNPPPTPSPLATRVIAHDHRTRICTALTCVCCVYMCLVCRPL